MISMTVEGVRRNFLPSSVFLYSVFLIDEAGQHLVIFHVERHEALPIVATLHHLPLPRPQTLQVMVETLTLLGVTLEEIHILEHSMLPPRYNLCSCVLRWHAGDAIHEQERTMRPGDAIGLALLMNVPILLADGLIAQLGTQLAEGQTPELVFAHYLLRREGISLAEGQSLRLGFGKTPARDALVKEFKEALLGKEPIFPEADMEQRKRDYLAFVLGEDPSKSNNL
jgi:bifunctional DNase/RNase